MGAFFLADNSTAGTQQIANATEALRAAGLNQFQHLHAPNFQLRYWHKANVAESPIFQVDSDNFCLHTGTLLYRETHAAAAARRVFDDYNQGQFKPEQLFGNFALLVCRNGELTLWTDALGIYPIWHDAELRTASSAMPALLASTVSPSLNRDAVYPYVFQEATFGGETPINGLWRLQPGRALRIDEDAKIIPGLSVPQATSISPDQLGDFIHQRLKAQFSAIYKVFSDSIDSALSGGYDSRLLLALCREQGSTPNLHVYGSDSSPDVLVAKRISQGEQIPLKHQNKAQGPKLTPEQFTQAVARNADALQSFPCDGIIDNGSDLATRLERTKSEQLLLNGGGGEVLRNFFYLPDRQYSPKQVLDSFYSQFDPAVCSTAFNSKRYYQRFQQQIAETVGHDGSKLERSEVEWLYPAFRCTYWMGQNNAINNQFGYFLTPLVDASIVRAAQRVPINRKNHGLFEAELIRHVSPVLASYPSDYGHDFSDAVPLKRRLKDWLTLLRPTWLRRYTYRFKNRSRDNWPYYLQDAYIQSLLPQGFRYMDRYFNIDKVNDAGQFKRICTLEYQLQRLNAND